MKHIIEIQDSHNKTIGQEATLIIDKKEVYIRLNDGRELIIQRKTLEALMSISDA
jgi:uncharacterized protein YacL (UPF0231 family)